MPQIWPAAILPGQAEMQIGQMQPGKGDLAHDSGQEVGVKKMIAGQQPRQRFASITDKECRPANLAEKILK